MINKQKIQQNKNREEAYLLINSWEKELGVEEKDIGIKINDKISDCIAKEKNEMDSYPLVLTAVEISEILKVSKPSAYELMNGADFPLIKIGRCKRVLRDQFFLWLNTKK
ncbi:helix-turn-helix domain-containing protein [Paenisporosarcina sp.]|uniref:helix-turn-helix domain-containing protein n=1 Tax=Paenisporosarcina sp. TaxID=1932001 RepID=UPI003C7351B1